MRSAIRRLLPLYLVAAVKLCVPQNSFSSSEQLEGGNPQSTQTPNPSVDLKTTIEDLGKALDKNKNDKIELIGQQMRLKAAVDVVGLQIAAIATRESNLSDKKNT
jgi:hypothetical protein